MKYENFEIRSSKSEYQKCIPAPNPRGIANKHSHNILLEQEKPKRANAVTVVLIAVILAVPKR